MKTITLLITDGPYISEYGDMAYKIAKAALKKYHVNIFLYLDGVHIPKRDQNPAFFDNIGGLFQELAREGARIEACIRCSNARGYPSVEGSCEDFLKGIRITSINEFVKMLKESDKVVALSR